MDKIRKLREYIDASGKPKNILTGNYFQKGSILPLYPWEKELGLTSLAQDPIFREKIYGPEKSERRTCLGFVQKYAHEYCDNTSVHGFKYVGDKSNKCCERVMWIFICGLSIFGTVLFLRPYFKQYFDVNLSITIDNTAAPIHNIPFPGVTICNINKASRSLIASSVRKSPWTNYTPEVVQEVIDFMSLFSQIPVDDPRPVNKKIKDCADEQNNEIDNLMREVIQPLERMILKCWWIAESVNCSKIFKLSRTDEGYCYSFNTLVMRELEPGEVFVEHDSGNLYGTGGEEAGSGFEASGEGSGGDAEGKPETAASQSGAGGTIIFGGFDDDEYFTFRTGNFTPLRVNGAGPTMGLTLLLNPDVEEYVTNTNNVNGFKVLIHDPTDFPSVAMRAFIANSGREIQVPVTATQIKSTDDVRNTSKSQRACRYPDEESLNLYTTYSHANCLLECQAYSMKHHCKCLPYIYSQLKTAPACDFEQMECINDHTGKFASIKADPCPPGLDCERESMEQCKCSTNCDEVEYTAESSTATFPKRFDNVPIDLPGVNRETLTVLKVYFKELTYIRYNRDLTYRWFDLLAAFGGISGLFTGFSLISAVELVYYFTIRPSARWNAYFGRKKE